MLNCSRNDTIDDEQFDAPVLDTPGETQQLLPSQLGIIAYVTWIKSSLVFLIEDLHSRPPDQPQCY